MFALTGAVATASLAETIIPAIITGIGTLIAAGVAISNFDGLFTELDNKETAAVNALNDYVNGHAILKAKHWPEEDASTADFSHGWKAK